MDVLRRFRALARGRPEKLVEDSLTSDCGALHLYHPGWYNKGHASSTPSPLYPSSHPLFQNGHAQLLSYEDLHSLSSLDFGLLLMASSDTHPPSSSSAQSDSPENHKSKFAKWTRPLGPPLKVVKDSVPKLKVIKTTTTTSSDDGGNKLFLMSKRKKNKNSKNEVFRSNSFRFERYDQDPEDLVRQNSSSTHYYDNNGNDIKQKYTVYYFYF